MKKSRGQVQNPGYSGQIPARLLATLVGESAPNLTLRLAHQLRGDRREVALLLAAAVVAADGGEVSPELAGVQTPRALALEVLGLHQVVLAVPRAPHRVRVGDGDVLALLDRDGSPDEDRGVHVEVFGAVVDAVVFQVGDGLVESHGGRGADGNLVGIDEEDAANGHDLLVGEVHLGQADHFAENLEDHFITFVSEKRKNERKLTAFILHEFDFKRLGIFWLERKRVYYAWCDRGLISYHSVQ